MHKQFIAAVAILLAATAAVAAPVLQGTTTNPTGITGLVVDGVTYNVTFSTVPAPSPFSAGSQTSLDAATSLASALNSLSVVALLGHNATLTITLVVMVDGTLTGDGAALRSDGSWIGFNVGGGGPEWGQYVQCFPQANPPSCNGEFTEAANFTVAPPNFSCQEFLAPFNQALLLRQHTNRSIPLAAQLFDTSNSVVTSTSLNGAAPPVVDVAYSSGTGPAVDETYLLDPVGHSSSGNAFSFDATTGNWRFNLSSSSYTASGIYSVTMKTGDATKYTVLPTCSGTFVRP
jgi:hypothetical protein